MATHQLGPLPELWRRWLGVVTQFARRAPGRVRLIAGQYEALQRALLTACQDVVENAEPELKGRLQRLEQLVRPWLNAASLENADKELLENLVARCRHLASGWLEPVQARRWLAWLFGVLLVIGCVLVTWAFFRH